MGIQVEHALMPARQNRLIDYIDRRTHLDLFIQGDNVLWIKLNAAVTDPHADTTGFIGAVDQVARPAQVQSMGAQGIVRPGWHTALQALTLSSMFTADGIGHIPGGSGDFPDNLGFTKRSGPAFPTDTDRMGYYLLSASCFCRR